MTQLAIIADGARRPHKENPLGLYIAVIKERMGASETTHKAAFKRLVLSEGYEDFIERIIDEWQSIKYSTALRAAEPIGIDEIRTAVARRRKDREAEVVMAKKAVKIIGSRLLDFVMPNGKKLRDCTFAYCGQIGGAISKVATHGKPNELVGKILSADQVQKIVNGGDGA